MALDLRRRSVRILRRVCGLQTILPRSCILSENISKEGDIAFASGGFADVWKGRHNGNSVCIKAFRAYTAENLSKIKQVGSQCCHVYHALLTTRGSAYSKKSSSGDVSLTRMSCLCWVFPPSCSHYVSYLNG